MDYLQIYQSPYKKIRLGPPNDGGYVICDVDNEYDFFISGGVGSDATFEESLLNYYPHLHCSAFDGTELNTYNSKHDRLQIIKKNLGSKENEQITNLSSFFKDYNNIFMKLDIEGGEVDLFLSFSDFDLLKIKQLVIEIHSKDEINIPKRLAKSHWLVHLHVNNCCGLGDLRGVLVPNVYECTYVRKREGETLLLNSKPIPDEALDQPNLSNKPDVAITWPPFVNLN
jgi:hypothetical protein